MWLNSIFFGCSFSQKKKTSKKHAVPQWQSQEKRCKKEMKKKERKEKKLNNALRIYFIHKMTIQKEATYSSVIT